MNCNHYVEQIIFNSIKLIKADIYQTESVKLNKQELLILSVSHYHTFISVIVLYNNSIVTFYAFELLTLS